MRARPVKLQAFPGISWSGCDGMLRANSPLFIILMLHEINPKDAGLHVQGDSIIAMHRRVWLALQAFADLSFSLEKSFE